MGAKGCRDILYEVSIWRVLHVEEGINNLTNFIGSSLLLRLRGFPEICQSESSKNRMVNKEVW